jgi:hypothetical protein
MSETTLTVINLILIAFGVWLLSVITWAALHDGEEDPHARR